jgi:rhodanese-related sulfurtransferase
MGTDAAVGIEAMPPQDAWRTMAETPGALLVDVRTTAEWTFVGTADTNAIQCPQSFIEWNSFPSMARNPAFLDALSAEVDRHGARALFFICRSGGRSHDAAMAASAHFGARGEPKLCVNVLEGFEGDHDAEGHRGALSGWKASGLPWRQS